MKTAIILILALLAGCAAKPESEMPTALKPEPPEASLA